MAQANTMIRKDLSNTTLPRNHRTLTRTPQARSGTGLPSRPRIGNLTQNSGDCTRFSSIVEGASEFLLDRLGKFALQNPLPRANRPVQAAWKASNLWLPPGVAELAAFL